MILLIAYDLHQPGRDYTEIEKALVEADGGSAHPQGSVWLVDTNETPAAWRNRLRDLGDPNDEFLVLRLQHNWASRNMDKEVVDWLKDPKRRW